MAFLENVFIEGNAGAVLDSVAGTPNSQAVTVQGNSAGVPIPVSGQLTAPTGTQTVTVVGTSTVQVAGGTVDVAGTSTNVIAGIVQVAPTGSSNTRVNPFFNEITDGTNVMGSMVAFGAVVSTSTATPVYALNANVAVQQGTVAIAGTSTVDVVGTVTVAATGTQTVTIAGSVGISGTPTVEVAGILGGTVAIAGTSTVEIAGILGTSTVTVAGTVTVAATGTQTVVVVGTSTVEVAGIVGTSTVVVAGTSTNAIAGIVASGGSTAGVNLVLIGGQTGTQVVNIAVNAAGDIIASPTGTTTVTVAGTSTVEVAGIVGTSTVVVSGGTVDVAGTSTVTVAGTVTVAATGTQTVTIAGSVGISGTPTVAISGTSTVIVSGGTIDIAGTSTVIVSGGTVDIAGTSTVTVVGTSTVEVAGIVGTSTVTVAGSVTVDVTGQIAGGAGTASAAASSSVLTGLIGNTATGTIVAAGQMIAHEGDLSGDLRVNPYGPAGSFQNASVTSTITASATLQVVAGYKWDIKCVRFAAQPSNTVTKQAVVWVTDSAGNVMWESASPVFTPTNTLMYEVLLYPGAMGPVNTVYSTGTPTAVVVGFVASARGTNTQVITLQIPEMYLGPSFQINGMLNGAAGTVTATLSANVLAIPN
jgi:hypothetical protein